MWSHYSTRYYARGGSGGGVVRLEVGGVLLLNGSGTGITASGNAGGDGAVSGSTSYRGAVNGGGGGAGGSVLVYASRIEGRGVIEARGGDGGAAGQRGVAGLAGGGGGGGRVALHCSHGGEESSIALNESGALWGTVTVRAQGGVGHPNIVIHTFFLGYYLLFL